MVVGPCITADPVSIQPSSRRSQDYYDDKIFLPTTFSAASIWNISNNQRLSLSLSRAQRALDAEEMYWNGDHNATFSYQLDNIDLYEEIAYIADMVWNITGENYFIKTAVYHYLFNDFIYNDLKDTTDYYHDNTVYRYEQKDTRFSDFEFSWEQQINNTLSTVLNFDAVRAELLEGDDKYIPRLPPATGSLHINWQQDNWLLSVENHWIVEQDRTARNETSTSCFQKLDLKVDYSTRIFKQEVTTSLAINNVFNSSGTNHVSYLKEYAPNPGRNI
jgi:iron complex outermembrane receptor protein